MMNLIGIINFKSIFGIIAIGLSFIAFFPYLVSILNGKTKPHVFSWIIWTITTFFIFIVQLSDNGGFGSWVIGTSAIISMLIALIAYLKKSDISIKVVDWVFFNFSLVAILVWYFITNPIWAVLLLTTIDIMAFFPTIRKTFFYPFDENLLFYVLIVFRNILSLIALEHYSIVTIFFPISSAVVFFIFIIVINYRRGFID
tara:strand:- start:12 stop:611 length:600 start_codon:yes stop_codon:yes gene_type:complete